MRMLIGLLLGLIYLFIDQYLLSASFFILSLMAYIKPKREKHIFFEATFWISIVIVSTLLAFQMFLAFL